MLVIFCCCFVICFFFFVVVVIFLLVFFYIGDIIDFSKVDLVGSGYFFCIYCIDNIVLCSFFFEVEIKLFFKYFV